MEEIETGSESLESGASEGSSSEASNSGSDGGTPVQTSAPEQKQDIDWAKAFEHPRFKELVADKNSYQNKYQDMESRYKNLEQQLNTFKDSQPKVASETDLLIADLKKVDPRLANVIERTLKASELAEANKSQFEKYQQQTQESQHQQTLSNAIGKINSLHESNKMSDFGKQFINNQLDLAYRGGKLNASDLQAVEGAYSEAAKAIKAYEDSFKRDITKSYVESKTKDASVPTSVPKGAQAKPTAKPIQAPKSKDDLKAAVVRSYMKEVAAQKDATNT